MEYTVRAAALATGVSEDRLRTWERRYGVPAPPRSGTGRRLYGEDDLAVIRRMAALIESGLSAASAAAAVLGAAAPVEARPAAEEVDPRVATLVQAADAMDDQVLLDMLGAAERALGVDDAVDRVALPALVEAGRRWERGDFTVAQEHLLSEAVRAWLVHLAAATPAPQPGAPRVLVACPEDERHDIGALALALMLRRAGARVAYLGGDVPVPALVDAARKVRFDAVCLSATAPHALPMARLACAALTARRGAPRVYLGGRAVLDARPGEVAPIAAVLLGGSLRDAAAMVVTQVGSARPAGAAG